MSQEDQNPCVGRCKEPKINSMCQGCFRLPFEIKNWWQFPEDKRIALNAEFAMRKQIYGDIL